MYYDLELVKLVVGAGADVNAIDNDGVSLHVQQVACKQKYHVYFDVIVALHHLQYMSSLCQLTALHLAVGGDYVEVCKCLIEQNADVNIKTGPNEV